MKYQSEGPLTWWKGEREALGCDAITGEQDGVLEMGDVHILFHLAKHGPRLGLWLGETMPAKGKWLILF